MFRQLLFLTAGGDSQAIVDRLSKMSQSSSFTELYISGIRIDEIIVEAVTKVLEAKKPCPMGVHIAHCTGSVSKLIQRILKNDQVHKLSLLADTFSPDFCAVGVYLHSNTSLQRLMIRVPLTNGLAKSLLYGLYHNRSLEELSILVSGCPPSAARYLASGLRRNQSLKKLTLNRSSTRYVVHEEENCNVLIRALKAHSTLTKLTLQSSACKTAGVEAIAELLRSKRSKLTRLDLSNHRLGLDRLDHFPALADALSRNRRLKALSLSGHQLTEKDISYLASALSNGTVLEELCLHHCGISDDSACILALWLEEIETLKQLRLNDNPMGHIGVRELCEAIKVHWELKEVLIPRCRGYDVFVKMIEFYLILNEGGRKLLKEDNEFPASLWPSVFRRAEDPNWDFYTSRSAQSNVIYHLLQGPAAFSR